MNEISLSDIYTSVKPSPGMKIVARLAKHELYEGGIISQKAFIGQVDIHGLSRTGRRVSSGLFSLSSRRRLRQFVVKNDIPDSYKIAVTLTLPNENIVAFGGQDFVGPMPESYRLVNGKPPSDYAEAVHHFGNAFRRRYPHSGFVWRNELQKRGLPHTHLVIYLSDKDYPRPVDVPGISDSFDEVQRSRWSAFLREWFRGLRYDLIDKWKHAVRQTCFIGSPIELEEWGKNLVANRGFDFQYLHTVQHAIRYIVDDMSKHKREQLGYVGNQWGVVARANFEESKISDVGGRLYVLLARIVGKMRRHSRKVPQRYATRCHFDTRKGHYYPAESGASYLLPDTMRKIESLIQKQLSDTKPPCKDSPQAKTQRFPLRFKEAGFVQEQLKLGV